MAEHLREEDLHAVLGEPLDVRAATPELGDLADQHAVDALHHHHVAAAQVPVHLGHVQQVGILEVAPQLRGVRRLAHQVELVEDGLLVLADDLGGSQAAALGVVIAREAREHVHHLEIALDIRAHAGPQHLDDDLPAVLEHRRVHLRDRCGRQRRLVEALEGLGDRPTVGTLDDRPRLGAREGRHAVLQLRELVGDVGRQQVAPRGERLAELDEDRPQRLEREPDPLAARAAPRALEPGRGRQVEHEPQRPEQVRREDDVVQPVPDEHALYGEQAAEHTQAHVSCAAAWLAGVAVAPRRETREPCLEPLDVVAQPVDVPQEFLDLDAHRHVASFLLQVLRGAGRERIGRAATEVEHSAREVRDPARRDVAHDLRQLFLEVRARLLEELAERLRDLRVALDAHLAAAQPTLGLGPGERKQRQRRAREPCVRRRVAPLGEHDPPVARLHEDPQRRVAEFELEGTAVETARQLLRAPRARDVAVQHVLRGARAACQ